MLNNVLVSRSCTRMVALSLALFLQACEAPLKLQAVIDTGQQPVKRTDFYQSLAANQHTLVLAGNEGVLLTSQNDGKEWQRQVLPSQSSVLSVATCPDQTFVAVTFDNTLWHGDAQGQNWTPHAIPGSEQMMVATCTADGSWWAAGSFSTFMVSKDQGQSWQSNSLEEDAIIHNLQFFDADNGVASAEYGLIVKTNNAGQDWQVEGYLPGDFYPHSSYFTSPQRGWVGGLNGFIYHTTDGGQSWQRQQTPTESPIYALFGTKDGLYALGDNTTVLTYQNEQWQALPTPGLPIYLRTGQVLDGNRLLVAGGRGLILDLPITQHANTDLVEGE